MVTSPTKTCGISLVSRSGSGVSRVGVAVGVVVVVVVGVGVGVGSRAGARARVGVAVGSAVGVGDGIGFAVGSGGGVEVLAGNGVGEVVVLLTPEAHADKTNSNEAITTRNPVGFILRHSPFNTESIMIYNSSRALTKHNLELPGLTAPD